MTDVVVPDASYFRIVLSGLIQSGWKITTVPTDAKIKRNGQALRLQWSNDDRAFRIFIFKVTGRGEQARMAERRIEITTTFQKNLLRIAAYQDVVLGMDIESETFVGIDPRRLDLGGPTGNASSNVTPDGLSCATDSEMLVIPHISNSLGSEYQAYFKATRLAEYLANLDGIHQGTYDGRGAFSGNVAVRRTVKAAQNINAAGKELILLGPNEITRPPIWKNEGIWKSFESGNIEKLRKTQTPIDFLELYRRQLAIGLAGELHALKVERQRLSRGKRPDLARKIDWLSKSSPFEGYDIHSFELDGTPRLIEVKATTGTSRRFAISNNEWSIAKQKGKSYYIYRITSIEKAPAVFYLRDPIQLLAESKIKLAPEGLTVSY